MPASFQVLFLRIRDVLLLEAAVIRPGGLMQFKRHS